jgi:transposase
VDLKEIFKPIPEELLKKISRSDLEKLVTAQSKAVVFFSEELEKAKLLNEELKTRTLIVNQQMITIRNKVFGRSSEKSKKHRNKSGSKTKRTSDPNKIRKKRILLPSERYPDARIIERDVKFTEPCSCQWCTSTLIDSEMVEESEFLTVIPKEYLIIRQRRHKYKCVKCYGDIQTAPAPPRIKPGSVMSDEFMIDVAMSKYCDLIPIERYCAMAGREGLENLPHHTLIGGTHHLADFAEVAYDLCRDELLAKLSWQADETTHNMLEGSETQRWYLWGFSAQTVSYFEIHDTRSGSVATDLLLKSNCQYFMSDVFSGYIKSINDTNKIRKEKNIFEIINGYCNAHARRKFDESFENYPEESQIFIDLYQDIYCLNKEAKDKSPEETLEIRSKMRPIYLEMKQKAEVMLQSLLKDLSLTKALNYFLNNFDGLTRFLDHWQLPIDNNFQESLFRNPVVGRKTWYGTHSLRGAKTAAIHFTLAQSCKINNVNPRRYYKTLVESIHKGEKPFTPHQYSLKSLSPQSG